MSFKQELKQSMENYEGLTVIQFMLAMDITGEEENPLISVHKNNFQIHDIYSKRQGQREISEGD